MTFQELLDELTEAARSNRDKGDLFERLIAQYFRTDPQYVARLSDVWMWGEWPHRWSADVGIDLVARERGTGDYWAIQCKFFDPNHYLDKTDIDSFFTASGKRFGTLDGEYSFAHRLIISTTDKWTKHAENALENQTLPVSRLWFKDLAESPIDWGQFSLSRAMDLRLKKKHELREHQERAIRDVVAGFESVDRGKLIMACGTGKTFAALRLAEKMAPENGRILFLAPSISLIAQSLREWTAQALEPIHAFVVCSDTKVGRDQEDIKMHDLAFPATTNAMKLVSAATALGKDRCTVVFSTYQSIQVVADAQRQGFGEFDLIICDEAHRTTGLTLAGDDPSEFVKVHHDPIVKAKKRLYMTATPRIYGEASKTKASEAEAVLFSMDDEETFGPEFHRLGFGKAVDQDLLSEYKVLIVAVRENEMAKLANNFNNAYKIDEKKAIDIRLATKIVGSWKGLSKQGLVLVGEDGQEEAMTEDPSPMNRAVAFSRSIKDSKQVTDIFAKLVGLYRQSHPDGDEFEGMVQCELDHVDGTMNALVRQEAIDWLKSRIEQNQCRILSNARCLSEGIDVPALDAVVFFDTRESIVDIVQSVGRVMRKADGKRFGYIILPVCIPSEKVKDYNAYIESDPQFRGIWKVVKALRAHDESLVDEAEFRRKIKVIGDGSRTGGEDHGDGGEQLPIDFPVIPLDAVNEAVYAAIPKKLGDREYWSEWAKSIGAVAQRLIARIEALIDGCSSVAEDFARFLEGLQKTLNPAVTPNEAVEMLAQHILTLPVFQALFAETNFPEYNAVGKALQEFVEKIDKAALETETEGLEKFYENVQERISLAKSDKSKQDIVRNLYDTFFQNAFPRMAERLGIVYTPVPVVDFILKSAEAALLRHFNTTLSNRDVQILDPFSGTGTFLVRLIQSGLIEEELLPDKFAHELHANEIVLLAYYIATVNIETAYHGVTGEYKPFDGMVLTDTFQMTEKEDQLDLLVLKENNARVERQLAQPIRVIVGNPPYSVGQDNANDNNKNLGYPSLDGRIRDTYAARTDAVNKNSLYDSYIRAIRWATDRIGDRGIVAFVTNGAFIDSNSATGLRQCLTEDYSHLYIFNLRGNQRTSGEESRREGGKIFGSGSRTPVAVSILVKDPEHTGPCELRYHDIGDYLKREEKLDLIEEFGSIDGIPWRKITPNAEGDWINQRSKDFPRFMALDDEPNAIFAVRSNGVQTNRDAWVYNASKAELEKNMARMIECYNAHIERHGEKIRAGGKMDEREKIASQLIDTDPKKIKWTSSLLSDFCRLKLGEYEDKHITEALYRPFCKMWLYYDPQFNHRYKGKIYPTSDYKNVAIQVTGTGSSKEFSCLMVNVLPDLEVISKGQCFPLYWYEKADENDNKQGGLSFSGDSQAIPDNNGFVRHDGITDKALENFRTHYKDQSITKEDIFFYVYGILHSPEYRERFAADLKKMLPRIPFAADFQAFREAGETLAEWHLNYDRIEPYPLTEEAKAFVLDPETFYRVHKMVFGKKDGKSDKSVIVYNANLTLRDIPLEAYEYVVNGKPAIEWVMERYAVTVDKDTGIRNDPNAWSDDPRYIVDLVKRVVRVSVESVEIIKKLPELEEVAP